MFYVGISAFVVALIVQFVDANDRLFSKNIASINSYHWLLYIGLSLSGKLYWPFMEHHKIILICCTSYLEKEIIIFAFSGIVGFFFEYKSLQMVPPSIVSILRTTEIVVAYVMNIVLTNSTPEIINSFGSILVLVAAIVLIFEKEIDKSVSYLCSRQKYEKLDEENNVINDKVN